MKKSPKSAGTKKAAPAPEAVPAAIAETKFPAEGLALVRRVAAVLDEKKALGIQAFFLGEKSPIADFYVIATGTSDPHLRALRIALEKAFAEAVPARSVRVQNEPNSGWCVADAFDVVVHIFSAEKRATYSLEELWREGERISL